MHSVMAFVKSDGAASEWQGNDVRMGKNPGDILKTVDVSTPLKRTEIHIVRLTDVKKESTSVRKE